MAFRPHCLLLCKVISPLLTILPTVPRMYVCEEIKRGWMSCEALTSVSSPRM